MISTVYGPSPAKFYSVVTNKNTSAPISNAHLVFDVPSDNDDTQVTNSSGGYMTDWLDPGIYGILMRINGCDRLGRSDGNDWIIDCEAQMPLHNLTEEAKEMTQQTSGLTPTDPTIVPLIRPSATFPPCFPP